MGWAIALGVFLGFLATCMVCNTDEEERKKSDEAQIDFIREYNRGKNEKDRNEW